MDISQIVTQTKDIILKELFTDVNDKCCVLDLCIENEGTDIKISQWDATQGDFFTPNIQSLSKVSQFFFEKKKLDLINEYNNETILLFRKHNYEKILNQYLENRYDIDNLEFSIIISEKEKNKLERKHKQELKEKNKEEKIKKQERNLIKNIEKFKWNKSIETNCIKYLATDKNGLDVEIQYMPNNQEKNNSTLLYDNQPLKYENYNINVLVDIIEKNIKDKLKSELKQKQTFENNIIQKLPYLTWKKTIKIDYITYTSIFKEKQIKLDFYGVKKFNKNKLLYDNQPLKFVKYNINTIVNNIENSIKEKLKQNRLQKNKTEKETKLQQIELNIINNLQYLNWKKLYKAHCIEYTSVDKNKNKFLLIFYDKQESYKNKLLCNNKPFKHIKCDVDTIVNIIEESIKQNKQKLYEETIAIIAKNYNTTIENAKNITDKYKSKCSYYLNGKCSFDEIASSNCSIENINCVFRNELVAKIKKLSEKNLIEQQNNNSISKSNKNKSMLTEIGLKDFVVRTNVFKCMHNKHKIDNIVAMINIDNDGKREQIKISAGYCNECKVYFILNSTYQALKNKGLILCRITDEKSYLKGNYANGIRLAKESILMQYGYNTSQTKGLSATGRQKILAVIIDNKIMSKSEIISYLDFFINQRSSQARMELAISKWETDREFVENYKIGQYTQFGVNAIYRR